MSASKTVTPSVPLVTAASADSRQTPTQPFISHQGWLTRLVWACATVMLMAATLIMVLEGMSRHFFSISYFWAEESVRFLLVWSFFLTLGIAGFQHYHIRTELLVQRFSLKTQRFCWLLSCAVGMGFAFILAYSSIDQVMRYYSMGMLSESNLELPMWLVFLAMPIGGSALFVYYASAAWHAWKWGDPFTPPEHDEGLDEATVLAMSGREPS